MIAALKMLAARDETDAVLKACSDAQWKLLFARSRCDDRRCRSDHLALRWGDVDVANFRISQTIRVGDEGRELLSDFSGKSATADARAAFLHASSTGSIPIAPDLTEVIAGWRGLSATERLQVLAIIRKER